jgi:hypothetical protein
MSAFRHDSKLFPILSRDAIFAEFFGDFEWTVWKDFRVSMLMPIVESVRRWRSRGGVRGSGPGWAFARLLGDGSLALHRPRKPPGWTGVAG